ncbi:MAG TPA: hypothetical protein VHM70_19215, partial [Polyangiaceae bacterium]|nr:hypothetical protein [Polyangiaceae bacterium]
MRSVLSFRFALLGSLGLLHACGARSTGGASATQIGDGKGDPQDEPTAPLGMQPPPVKPAIAPDLPAPIHPTPAPTPVPTLTTPPVAGLLDSVCPPPERESQFGPGLFECRNGMVHREVAIDCGPVPDEEPLLIFPSSPISASSIGDGGVILGDAGARTLDVSACEKNADCVSKNNGRCRVYNEGNDIRTRCEYPCVTDSDCSPQEVCECHGDIRDCVYAHCRTDAECAPGHACARYVFNECGSAKQYACTTDADGCHTAQDCGFEDNPRIAGCVPHSNGGAQCDSSECIEGRPFLVSGVARTAAVVERTDWTSPIVVDLTRLDTEQCLYLSEHWARIGQMEHASIAA